MLTEDGQLVEVDVKHLTGTATKIENKRDTGLGKDEKDNQIKNQPIMDDQINSRRDFIAGALTTVACASCSCGGKDHSHDETEVKPSGEKVKLLSVNGEVIEVDRAFLKPVPDLPQPSNDIERKGIEGKKFVMVIDLSRCKNVGKCRESCNHAHCASSRP